VVEALKGRLGAPVSRPAARPESTLRYNPPPCPGTEFAWK
jgi:hypothetical protein